MLRVIEAALAANDTDVPRRLDIRCNAADSKVGVFVFRNGQLLGDAVAYDLDAQTVTRCIGGTEAEPIYVTEQYGVHVSWIPRIVD